MQSVLAILLQVYLASQAHEHTARSPPVPYSQSLDVSNIHGLSR